MHDGAFTITALGDQRFRFALPDGTVIEPAPAIRGHLDDLLAAHTDVTALTIEPDWNGAPLTRDAVSTYLTAWAQRVARGRR